MHLYLYSRLTSELHFRRNFKCTLTGNLGTPLLHVVVRQKFNCSRVTASGGIDIEHRHAHDSKNTNKVKQPALSSLTR